MKLKKLNYGKNKNHKILLYGLISAVVLLLAVTFLSSRANYKISSSVQLAKGKINYKAPDLNIIGMYINEGDGNYTELSSDTPIPKEGYTINQEKSYCYKTTLNEHDTNVKFSTNVLGEHIMENLSRNDKCYLYFDKITYTSKTMSEILETNYSISIRTSENKDFNVPFGATTYGVVYEAEDDYGTSYYFAGGPLDNWVKFGKKDGKDIWWRIIRINGDGSIRMIYTGTNAPTSSQTSVMTGGQTHIGASVFSNEQGDNKYVGYFYEQDKVHGTKEASTIYEKVNNFYVNNIKGQTYEKWIDRDAGFCNDRTPVNHNGVNGDGIGATRTNYAALARLRVGVSNVTLSDPAVQPTLKCETKEDLFTTKASGTLLASKYGNNILENPIGLITADEVSYAGMVFNSGVTATTNYLYTNEVFWTMSAYHFDGSNTRVLFVGLKGYLSLASVDNTYGVRPVINLKADTPLIGNGTYNNPYRLAP